MTAGFKFEHVGAEVNLIARLLRTDFWWLVAYGALANVCVIIVFAALFMGLGDSCVETAHFTTSHILDALSQAPTHQGKFLQRRATVLSAASLQGGVPKNTFRDALALSVHTFTTVGYGSVVPTCVEGNGLVVAETFCAVLVTAFLTGVMVAKVLQARPAIQFSTEALITEIDGISHLVFRLVRSCNYPLMEFTVKVFADFASSSRESETFQTQADDGRIVSSVSIPLTLVRSERLELHQFEVRHKIDETSPLHKSWKPHQVWTGLGVVTCYFDTSYNQECRQYHRYSPAQVIPCAKFDDMVQLPGGKLILFHHAKLNVHSHQEVEGELAAKMCTSEIL